MSRGRKQVGKNNYVRRWKATFRARTTPACWKRFRLTIVFIRFRESREPRSPARLPQTPIRRSSMKSVALGNSRPRSDVQRNFLRASRIPAPGNTEQTTMKPLRRRVRTTHSWERRVFPPAKKWKLHQRRDCAAGHCIDSHDVSRGTRNQK